MSDKIKLKLLKPIEQGSEKITHFEFREPLGKDLRDFPLDMKSGDLLDLASALCAQPKSVMDKLSAKDTMKVLEIVSVFIAGGPETGENS